MNSNGIWKIYVPDEYVESFAASFTGYSTRVKGFSELSD